jgi:hypothetical protein
MEQFLNDQFEVQWTIQKLDLSGIQIATVLQITKFKPDPKSLECTICQKKHSKMSSLLRHLSVTHDAIDGLIPSKALIVVSQDAAEGNQINPLLSAFNTANVVIPHSVT